ncbi:MAG: site-specific integrase [Clostridiales bacterium]|nr:site-specific integrase [Clostridiales bacterium]
MSVHKDPKTGTWFVMARYTTVTGEKKQKCKRGFITKREAQAWEREFLLADTCDVSMTFETFAEQYLNEMRPRLKQNTFITKENIFRHHIIPYFGKRKLAEITPKNVRDWQTEILKLKDHNGKPFASCYLKTIHNQLSACFNYAVKFYGLSSNPAFLAGNMGKERTKEMSFWTQEEYRKFSYAIMDKVQSFYAFEVLYWTGIREGELLALTPEDFDFETKTLRINKSYQRLHGKDLITTPKTVKSNRTIKLPQFLCDEMEDYFSMFYQLDRTARIFPVTKHFLFQEMQRGCKISGVKRIRIHDLRHSHISLLIDMGFTPVAIAERVGHESIDITYRYAHLFPTVQSEMAEKLNESRKFQYVAESV